jgi:hypothetical protein
MSMHRWFAAVIALGLSTSALGQGAQPTPPPPPPPTSDVPSAQPGAVSLSGQQQAKSKRYGRFAAGPGGPLFVFSEIITGMVAGGLIGGGDPSSTTTDVYLGVIGGGIVLGTIAALYQYYVPIGMGIAALTVLSSASGFLLGAGIWQAASMSQTAGAAIGLVLSQAAVAAALIATHGVDDVPYDDVALVGMVTAYVTALTFLISDAIQANTQTYTPVLFAPAVGMGLGALLATQLHIPSSRILKLVALPLGVGLILFYIGALVAGSPSHALGPVTATIGIIATFALTFIFTQPDNPAPGPAPTAAVQRDGFWQNVAFAPVIAPVGPDRQSLAVGPGLLGRF